MRQLTQIGRKFSEESRAERLLAVAYSVLGRISFDPQPHNSGSKQETTLDYFDSSNREKTRDLDKVCEQLRSLFSDESLRAKEAQLSGKVLFIIQVCLRTFELLGCFAFGINKGDL